MKAFCVPEIFLDANATTIVLPEVVEAMRQVSQEKYGNPSSPHMAGMAPKAILDNSRSLATTLFNGVEGRFIFNSGATEGINTAVFSALLPHAGSNQSDKVLLFGATEHKAVPEALKHWNRVLGVNAEVLAIPVNERGELALAMVQENINNSLLICTMGANNETGVVQNLQGIADIRKQAQNVASQAVPWLVDSVQVLGKLDLDLQALNIDYATFSAHKLYGPKGVGCLYVRNGAALTPLQVGGGQESNERGGTENVAGIAALGVIFNWLLHKEKSPLKTMSELAAYRETLLVALRSLFPKLVLNQPYPESLPTTINFSVPGYSSGELIAMFDSAGIRVSAGSACSAGRPMSFVLDAMGFPAWRSEGAVRLSFGPAANAIDIQMAANRIAQMAEKLSASQPVILSGLLVPEPTQRNFAVIANTQQRKVTLFGTPSNFSESWLAEHFPAESWNHHWLSAGEHHIDGYQVLFTNKDEFSVVYKNTERSLYFNQKGVVLSHDYRSKVAIISGPESVKRNAQFIDVREYLESAMQAVPSLAGKTIMVPRCKWCQFALTFVAPSLTAVAAECGREAKDDAIVTVCRSGGRSLTVAGLVAVAGGPLMLSCEHGATDIAQYLVES